MKKVTLPNNSLKLDISAVEKYYGAKYVGEFPVPIGEGFASYPASIFRRRDETHKGPNAPEYFGITEVVGQQFRVIDADYIVEYIFNGLSWGDEVIYSRFETDRQTFDNAAFIAGGFTKREWHQGEGVPAVLVRLQVQGGEIVVLE